MFNWKKMYILVCALFALLSTSYALYDSIELGNNTTLTEVVTSARSDLTLYYQFDRLNYFTVDTEEGEFTEIYINSLAHTNVVGEPKLPMSRRFIEVPLGAEVTIQAINYRLNEYELSDYGIKFPIIPQQYSVAKCPDAEIPPFEFDSRIYSR